MKPIAECFPEGWEARSVQAEVMAKIQEAVDGGARNIVINAPVGCGKSGIVVAAAKAFGSSAILTGQKVLQDQYAADFPFLQRVKGKSNFKCDKADTGGDVGPLNMSLVTIQPIKNAGEAVCNHQVPKLLSEDTMMVDCEFKGNIDVFRERVTDRGTENERPYDPDTWRNADGKPGRHVCDYYRQKWQALAASHAIFNYAAYFALSLGGDRTSIADRRVVICDEAHEIEDWLIGFVGIEITQRQADLSHNGRSIDECEDTVEDIRGFMRSMRTHLEGLAMEAKDTGIRLTARQKQLKGKLDYLLDGVLTDENLNNFVAMREENARREATKLVIKPLDVSRYVADFFPQPVRIFLSGTINEQVFSEMMGFTDKTAYIEVETHPFPQKNRPVEFSNVASLSAKSTPADWAAVYDRIDQIMSKHSDEKGLILTTSKKQAHDIEQALSAKNRERLLITYANYGEDKAKVLADHGQVDKAQVLCSPSLWTGADLKDDRARFVIVVKCPYPSLGDKRIRIKCKRNQKWYSWQALMKLMQGMGRGVRTETDWCVTYCVDAKIFSIMRANEEMIPLAYRDVLEVAARCRLLRYT